MEISMHEACSGGRSSTEVFEALKADSFAASMVAGVRAEQTVADVSDLSILGEKVVPASRQGVISEGSFRTFESPLSDAEMQKGLDQSAAIFFLCRSGIRNTAADTAMPALDYKTCRTLAGGFEGSHNAEGQNGPVSGWKKIGLPWSQG